ncbi:hypothetical protein B0H16DRAFT_1466651 [Mycena metata]|uniref:Uncharacterized protein n=1 Tax=Mycena metata TaxID=1033252 RepID=A0AAD7I8D4_9AGAR|nr:hypothetical protein B0H16DRAFT_1466651 [Mycena metata]
MQNTPGHTASLSCYQTPSPTMIGTARMWCVNSRQLHIFRSLKALQARPASCKAMLKFEPRQIGNIHIPAYECNVPKNHPPIDIFDAAIVPLTQLLISFPNDHPVFNSYNRFFTELAMRRCLGTDRIRVWNPHWWRKTWKSSGSALLERPLDILLDDASSDEWWHRVLFGTRILLLLSTIQLEESLNLNGDIFEDLGQGYHSNFLRLPRGVARHRLREPDMERPPIPIDNLPGIEELSAKARFRPASEHEDAPAPKHRFVSHTSFRADPKDPKGRN